jgi:hypothetical protein
MEKWEDRAKSQRTVRISGSNESILQAFKKVMHIVRLEMVRLRMKDDRTVSISLPNAGARLLAEAGSIEEFQQSSGATLEMKKRNPKEHSVHVCGSTEQTESAVRSIVELTCTRENGRHQEFLAQWDFETDYNDHFETPKIAYADILPVLEAVAKQSRQLKKKKKRKRKGNESDGVHFLNSESLLKDLVVYDPYFCQGRVCKLLGELGCGAEQVINSNRDFYADVAAGTTPSHDLLLTNPPFSGEHKQKMLDYLLTEQEQGVHWRKQQQLEKKPRQDEIGAYHKPKPFMLLMPAWVARGQYWREFLEGLASARQEAGECTERKAGKRVKMGELEKAAGVFYVCPAPSRPYQFDHPQSTQRESGCPFFGAWFVGGFCFDYERQQAMAALKSHRQGKRGDGVEVFRSIAMMKKRGHFETKSVTKGLFTTLVKS